MAFQLETWLLNCIQWLEKMEIAACCAVKLKITNFMFPADTGRFGLEGTGTFPFRERLDSLKEAFPDWFIFTS